ncbi:lantibiotic biosynthesis protein [Streptomyces abyssalis]|uniref:Lantibiotic biosynthesis protein n=1 Tax=Streptomyces abyssalis TaxID=933944 RepID=A0A1E7JU73_9ACTN|nr:lantibiotic dehydratase C-terminal domain-containing protein [Streptomyces abyssalis]OEU88851.1 lantibiotic biosynthesis protein [Streptomyces abyssalis]OEU93490.1 lantibiotic biosynthesis protein [Streptomyces abyssalis]OEV06298.1 lantibiotic biosynthesis protein [Streptomyces nanshensis]
MPEESREPGEWQAVHVFYAANPQPLLVNCIRPLVASLRDDGLLAGHFFLNYWLEGPHVRLRLRPARAEDTEEVRGRAEEAIDAFLRARPALYEVDTGFLNEFYNALFEIEFPEGDRSAFMGEDGRMNLRPNNSRSWEPYSPEYRKYGGPAGVELAEWHFAHSSDLVAEAFSSMNLHLRTVLLGTSAQLMMVMLSCFLPDARKQAEYLDQYYEFWHRAFPGTGFIGSEEYDRNYAQTAPGLGRRYREIRQAVAATRSGPGGGQGPGGRAVRLPAFLSGWSRHCTELSERVVAAASRGELVFASPEDEQAVPTRDLAVVLPTLLSPYMHMTNNRLHVTIRDEAYLAHILGRVLREDLDGAGLREAPAVSP